MNIPPPSVSLASLSLGLVPAGGAPSREALPGSEASGEWFLASEPGARISLPTHAATGGDPAALAQRVLAHLVAGTEA